MAPGPIPRHYATEERVMKIEKEVERIHDIINALTVVTNVLARRVYGIQEGNTMDDLTESLESLNKWKT